MDLANKNFLIVGQLKTSRTECLEDYLYKRVNSLGVIGLMSPFSSYNEARCSFYEKGDKLREFPLDSFIIRNKFFGRGLIFIYFFVFMFSVFKAVVKLNKKFHVYIGIATFSALLGVILKNMKVVDKVIYYCLDYYPPPKKDVINIIENFIYKYIDLWLIKKADIVWEISPKIKEGRKLYTGFDQDSYKRVIVPLGYSNNINFNYSVEERDLNSLGFVGTLSRNQGLELVIEAMPELIRKFPNIKVKVIGHGPYAKELKDLVSVKGMEKNFIFYGFIKDDREVFNILSSCSIGLATWRGDETDNSLYADPGKAKLYALLGLPIVITSFPWVASLIAKCRAGEVIDYNCNQLISAIEKIIINKESFRLYQEGIEKFKPYCLAENIFNQAFSI